MSLRINSIGTMPQRQIKSPNFGKTLAIIKPDAIEKRSEILIRHLLPAGFQINKFWIGVAPRSILEKHYANISDKPFFQYVVDFMHSGEICVMELELDAKKMEREGIKSDVEEFRKLTLEKLRSIYGTDRTHNAIHASDSVEAAERELDLWRPLLELRRYAHNSSAPNTTPL